MKVMCLVVLLFVPGFALACESDRNEQAAQGKKLYHEKGGCFTCHGKNGDGKTDVYPSTGVMKPRPTGFENRTALKFPSIDAQFSAIRNGISASAMPPFHGKLSDNEIDLIIEYLKALKTGGC